MSHHASSWRSRTLSSLPKTGRIYIELVNAAFVKAGGTAEQFLDGIQRAVDEGWMVRHESGTYVKFTDAGAVLFA
jgi:hypothetical protein